MKSKADEMLAAPGIFDEIIEHGAGWRDEPRVGPTRPELLELMGT